MDKESLPTWMISDLVELLRESSDLLRRSAQLRLDFLA
jgi:hypothetical protein